MILTPVNADDIHLHFRFKPLLTSQHEVLRVIEACIADDQFRMITNRLKMNDTEMEFLIMGLH